MYVLFLCAVCSSVPNSSWSWVLRSHLLNSWQTGFIQRITNETTRHTRSYCSRTVVTKHLVLASRFWRYHSRLISLCTVPKRTNGLLSASRYGVIGRSSELLESCFFTSASLSSISARRRSLGTVLLRGSMINLSSIDSEKLEILHPFFHMEKFIYTMNKALLPNIKTASPMHPFEEPKEKPSAERMLWKLSE